MKVGAVILGAGFGRRFGADKRVADLAGKSVAERTLEKYLVVFDKVRLVVRQDDDDLTQRIAHLNVEIVISPHADQGMGHSLAAGFTNLSWDWAFVGLLDMPFVSEATLAKLKSLANEVNDKHIIRPFISASSPHHYGHPVGWHQRHFARLATCQGDSGAQSVLREHPNDIYAVAVADPGILQDIDRPEDLTTPLVS